MNRRTFLGKALALTAAGVLLPEAVAAEPERRVWAFPQNPIAKPIPPFYIGDGAMWHQRWDGPWTDALHYNFPQRLHVGDYTHIPEHRVAISTPLGFNDDFMRMVRDRANRITEAERIIWEREQIRRMIVGRRA